MWLGIHRLTSPYLYFLRTPCCTKTFTSSSSVCCRSRSSPGLEYQRSTLSLSLARTRGWILFKVQVLLFALLASAQSHIIPQQVIFNHNWCGSKRITFINLIKACQWFNGRYYFGWESVGEEIKSLWHKEALKPFKTQRAHCGGHGTRFYLSNKCQVRPTQVCVLTVSLILSATVQWTCWLVRRLLLTPQHSPAALPAHCLSLFQPRSSKNALLQLGSESSPNKLTRETAECL